MLRKNLHCADDIIDTAGTLCNAERLKRSWASKVKAYITHPVLSGPAIERINDSSIDELVVTNSFLFRKKQKNAVKYASFLLHPLLRVH